MSFSPELRDIGNFAGRRMMKAPEKSNFSQTCNLLSQYLKENGRFGDLNFGANSPRDLGKLPAMDLFPQHNGFGTETDFSEMKEAIKPKAKQMTIIYGGRVLVFDDISEEKVKELMTLANNGISSPNLDLSAPNNSTEERVQMPIQAHVSALPIARKASLHRFLEKRKDRINARAPYQVNNSAASKETKAWLGLASSTSIGLGL